jgi:hypothetical protein
MPVTKPATARLTEHGLEPIPGLPEALPAGEVLLWQGAPAWTEIAQRVFLIRWVMFYFLALAAWDLSNAALRGDSIVSAIGSAAILLLGGSVGVGILALLAKLAAKTSMYSITSRRLVLRVGVALPITINIPFAAIAGAGLRQRKDGHGDIVMELLPSHRISWIALWPHCAGWSFGRPKPMLRGVADAANVARILGEAVANAGGAAISRGQNTAEAEMPSGATAMA